MIKIWAHPGAGKTYLYQLHPELVIDFDSVYKDRLSRELNIPETYEARKEWRKTHREEYNNKLIDLFNEAIIDCYSSGKILLVSDLLILQEYSCDIDFVIQMSEETFKQRTLQRNEPWDLKHQLWKQDIDNAINSIRQDKVILYEGYLSDLLHSEA